VPASGKIQRVLVANRGEIAVRVIRTCREMGIETVAVFSEPDRTALHVRMADHAFCIGPAASSASYLLGDRILEVALTSGCDAIHPGYGFLSENADFAESCEAAGVCFIGPPPEAIRMMGDKTAARRLMESAGVPMAPGTVSAVSDPGEALRTAVKIGFPILIKAAAGGGGKGMRVVESEGDFLRSMQAAKREAMAAFADERVFIEKYIVQPKHIEFQILADSRGQIVHLFERDCSIQRRHQKVIEEAPSPALDPDLRERMARAALDAARSCGYVGAGTVEFLLDAGGAFYFMEMNTRLQVEHPVTEWITGVDLVAAQIRIAEGQPLSLSQSDLNISGHAIECRVYAEDPRNGFLPDPGRLTCHRPPSGLGVRVDAGVEEGDEVSIHYDPMISKLTAWGQTRSEALARMRRAIDEYEVSGVETTLGFCRLVLDHESFVSGTFSTHFVQDHFDADLLEPSEKFDQVLAAFTAVAARARSGDTALPAAKDATSRWAMRRE
jgi:acetyl-CoA carboxylase biotin carboxylase subunit